MPLPLKLHKLVLALFFLALNLGIYGYEYGINSYHDYLLPYINKIIDPSLYPDDAYIKTMPSFPSFYIYLIGALAKAIPLETIHCVMYLAARFVFFIVLYQLTFHFFKNRTTCLISLFLFATAPLANSFGLLGDEPVMKFLLYQTTLTVPLFLLSIYLFIRQRYTPALVLLAVLYYFNGLYAVYTTAMFLGASLLLNRPFQLNKPILKAWFTCGAILLPWFFWTLSRMPAESASPDFMTILRNYYSGHCFPLAWPASKWLIASSFIIFFLIFLKQSTFENKKLIKIFTGIIFILWAAGFVFVEWIPFRFPTVLMPFRSDVFFAVFGLIFAADYIRRLISSQKSADPFLGMLLVLVFTSLELFKAQVLMAFLGFFLLFFLCHEKENEMASLNLRKFRSILYYGYLIFFFFLSVRWLWSSPLHFKTYFLLALFTGFLFLAEKISAKAQSKFDSRLYIYILLFLVLLPHSDIIQYRIRHGTLSYHGPIRQDWKTLQLWVEQNTSPDSRFVVPPYLNGFRTYSKRPVFVEKIDGGAMHWHAGFETVWAKRLEELGYGKRPLLEFKEFELSDPSTQSTRSIYAALGEDKFRELKRKYKIDFVVEEKFRVLFFPVIYENSSFVVYRIL